ncbi:hypothetical protein [Nostoc sp. 'Lobaria pulmonaria (5183) cyanobiont']|uniref:hypothetical protein n=1 Tax=Nostoc sp. 'Lobaria pulmonaria (5183) cyanobiont' TaxID=1618022 RepID=UPI000CF32DC8|nr:hypothetical protein [Nostoc sp. 'Lobaria pulmonaria (5183) cyanobiont']AVH69305.1 hypothetical protein NLP_0401 [Nostoc sp. 'Lobaria pulmonaria (5183) cyanobiont']
MSSGSSGRYQSRLFNFVHQQSRRVTQQWEHTFRHLQVATKWGVEVLLYPVYLLFQSSESSGKTLHTKEPQARLKLQPNDTDFQPETLPNADTPIQNVLEAVNYLSSDEPASTPTKASKHLNPLALLGVFRLKFVENNSNLIQSSNITDNQAVSLNPSQLENALQQRLPIVRGIATNLISRNLVLVTADNEILDILTPEQQAKLEDRIINEVAKYWQSSLREAARSRSVPLAQPLVEKEKRLIVAQKETELLPQIDRLLAKLTDANPDEIPVLAEDIPKDLLNTDRLLTFLDIAIAKLESNALVPVQERSQEIVQVAQTQLNIFLYGKEQLATKGEIAPNADGLETHSQNFQALIEAALNYFFGVGNRKTLETTTSNERLPGKLFPSRLRKALSKSPLVENQDLTDDPWLRLNDLFGDTEAVVDKPIKFSGKINPALAPSLSVGHFPQKNLSVKQPKIGSGLVKRKQPSSNLTSSQKTSGKVASAKQTRTSISQTKSESRKGEILQQQSNQSSQVEAQPDWIETKATSTGYEKHPLEQLLEWLDYVMVWLEERFVKIFQSLRQLWQGK